MYKKSTVILIILSFLCFSLVPNSYTIDRNDFGNITLDLKNVDILDVLKIFSMHSGMSIVAGQDVRTKVTIFLKDVNVWDAFEVILAANNLAYKEEGGIVKVLTERSYIKQYGSTFYDKTITESISLKNARAEDVSNALNQIRSEFGKVIVDARSNTVIVQDTPEMIKRMKDVVRSIEVSPETKVFVLKYADVEKMAEKIKENLTEGIGFVEVDERTGKIAVTDIPPKIDQITKMLDSFDEKSKEVLIEAKIVEITLNKEHRLGISWESIFKKFDELGLNFEKGDLVYYTDLPSGGFKLLMDAFKEMGDIRVVSQPKILALNHKEATIKIAERQPYITTNVTAVGESTQIGESITFLDIGTQLSVIPDINKDGYITMDIKPKVSSAPDSYAYVSSYGGVLRSIPIERTSEVEATVMVKDGKTMVIGGLMRERVEENKTKVPFLGNIPVVGGLFKHRTYESKNTELAIFLTPRILTGDESVEVEKLKQEGKIVSSSPESKKPTFSWLKKGKKNAYTDYYLTLSSFLSKHIAKNYLPSREGGKVNLVLTLDSEGNLISQPKVTKSPNKELAQIAQALVMQIQSFPKFPGDLQKRQEAFRISINLPSAKDKFPVLDKKEIEELGGFSSKDKIFSDYYLALSERISDYMMKNYPSTKGGKLEISFKLSDDGKLLGRPKILNKVNPQLRELAIQSMREISPFKPFPDEFKVSNKKFRILINIPKSKFEAEERETYGGKKSPFISRNSKSEDSSEYVYQQYKHYISKKVSKLINAPSGERGEVKVKFQIDSDGVLIDNPEIVNSSNNKLSKVTIDAVKKAAPFPKLPQAVSKNQAMFEISIVYE